MRQEKHFVTVHRFRLAFLDKRTIAPLPGFRYNELVSLVPAPDRRRCGFSQRSETAGWIQNGKSDEKYTNSIQWVVNITPQQPSGGRRPAAYGAGLRRIPII